MCTSENTGVHTRGHIRQAQFVLARTALIDSLRCVPGLRVPVRGRRGRHADEVSERRALGTLHDFTKST